jgi:hypothetical protein
MRALLEIGARPVSRLQLGQSVASDTHSCRSEISGSHKVVSPSGDARVLVFAARSSPAPERESR